MKIYSLFVVTFCLLLSCNKHDDSKPNPVIVPTKNALIVHTWIYDSSRLFFPDTNYLIISSQQDNFLNFTDSLWINIHPINVKDTFRYEFVEPDTLHRWQPPQARDPLEYFLVNTVTDRSLNIIYRNQSYSSSEYFHAK